MIRPRELMRNLYNLLGMQLARLRSMLILILISSLDDVCFLPKNTDACPLDLLREHLNNQLAVTWTRFKSLEQMMFTEAVFKVRADVVCVTNASTVSDVVLTRHPRRATCIVDNNWMI